MKISFDVIVLLRTDKNADAVGHPVDRISLNDFINIDFNVIDYEASFESFTKWNKDIDFSVNKFLYSIFYEKFIIGESEAIGADDTSEKHIIRVDDIRNVVVINYQETKFNTFEDAFNFRIE